MNNASHLQLPDPGEPGWPEPLLDEHEEPDDAPDAAPAGPYADQHADPHADHSAGPALQRVSDAQLAAWIDAVVARDEQALAALYDATFNRLYSLVQRIVRREALAEEVVEDSYFQVWRQAPRFDPARGSAISWLLAIARSRAIDALRREARFQHASLDDQATDACDGNAGSDELLELARHHADLHRALLQLGAQPRQLVSLAFFRGLSHEEIALQTRLPLGTVKSQIRRALITLRQVLGETGLPALAS